MIGGLVLWECGKIGEENLKRTGSGEENLKLLFL